MALLIELKNGRQFRYDYAGTWQLFLWSLDAHGGVRGSNGFIARDQIATIVVEGGAK